jgi:DNA polymerase I-like protein with 3'-5' exonuclease and polymerase domains
MIPFPLHKDPVIEVIEDLEVLYSIKDTFAWDLETNSLKAQSEKSKIISCAIADTADHAFVFMMPEKRSQRIPLTDLLTNPDIGKVAHNMKFEGTWAKEKLGVEVQGWVHDTMLMCHTLDNRQGITSLKFQTLVNFGIFDYSSMTEPYLEGIEKKNGNSLNRIEELISTYDGKQQLLKYNALDAVYEYRLWKLQELENLPF